LFILLKFDRYTCPIIDNFGRPPSALPQIRPQMQQGILTFKSENPLSFIYSGGETGIRTLETATNGLLDFEFCGGLLGYFQPLPENVQCYRLPAFIRTTDFPLITGVCKSSRLLRRLIADSGQHLPLNDLRFVHA